MHFAACSGGGVERQLYGASLSSCETSCMHILSKLERLDFRHPLAWRLLQASLAGVFRHGAWHSASAARGVRAADVQLGRQNWQACAASSGSWWAAAA